MTGILGKLDIKDYRLSTFIGCAPEEHLKPQDISIDLSVYYSVLPNACKTDYLTDSYCYQELSDIIYQTSIIKHYELIEHLAYAVFNQIKIKLNQKDYLWVKLTKLQPPVQYLKGGASFSCYDEALRKLLIQGDD